MRCVEHDSGATGVCPFCGRAMCVDCAVHSSGSRRACSPECLRGLAALDEAALISTTKGSRTLKANVTFCVFLGSVFALIGVVIVVMSPSAWPAGAFLLATGMALIIGGMIYARALRERISVPSPPDRAGGDSTTRA